MKYKSEAERILRKARTQLLISKAFFGVLALRMTLIETKAVPTTAVDARGNFYYNKDWVEKFDNTDAMFEVAHEIGHLIFRHHARKPAGAIPSIWNIAGDQIIDTQLVQDGLEQSAISKKMVPHETQEECKRPDGKIKTSEERYRDLIKKMKDCPACRKVLESFKNKSKAMQEIQDEQQAQAQKEKAKQQGSDGDQESDDSDNSESPMEGGSQDGAGDETSEDGNHVCGGGGSEASDDPNSDGSGGSSGGSGMEGEETESGMDEQGPGGPGHICGNVRQCCAGSIEETDAQTVEEWKQYILGAAKAAQAKGDAPGIAADFLSKLGKPSRDWRDVVRAQASKVYRGRYTLKKRSRRSSAIGVVLPARQPKPEPALCVIDCSGSVGIKLIHRFMTECKGVLEASGAQEIYLMFHDVMCYDEGYFTQDMLTKIKVTHGGTSHMDVWQHIEDLDFTPGIIICFTDLYSDQMQLKTPGVPTIWCHPRGNGGDQPIPFGIKLEVPDDMED